MFYAGIDLGTSAVKLVLTDENGDVVKTVTKEYPISFPSSGYSEQNPEDWYEKTLEGLKELAEGREIRALSFGGQMHGLVMLDENDEVLRPAILWNDARSGEECRFLNEEIGRKRMTEMTGNIAFPGFTAPKIMWVKKHEPEIFARCKKIMLPKDYLMYRLCGEFVTEPSDAAGTLLYDVKNGCWSREMLEICSIDESMLPEIRKSAEIAGYLKPELGFGKVGAAPGGGDNAAAAVGMGVIGDGGCSISVGTSGTVFITSSDFKTDEKNSLHAFAHTDGGYALLGCILSAAACNKWWMEDILDTRDFSHEQEAIVHLGDNKVYFLPYLMGERSPHNDPFARGAFVGMSMATKRKDMTQAVLEGVAYALRDCVEAAREQGIEINEAKLCGGGAKSPLWQRILANVLKVRLILPKCTEGPGYGAALMAMAADGRFESLAETKALVKTSSYVDYDEKTAKKYDAGYERFKGLYRALKNWYKN